MSSPSQWEQLDRLFEEALTIPAADREAWAQDACGKDDALRVRLLRMLAAHDAPGFLDRPLTASAQGDLSARVAAALTGRYVIVETLGSGGMATVFRARECKHDRHVVIKVLQPGVAAALGDARFHAEVRIAARLSHPHILTLIDSGSVNGLLYYVTPYVGGVTMREKLRTEGRLELREAVGLLRDIADALAHAHAAGIVHRDLKPDNVLCLEGHAFLLDFGVAKLETDSTRPHTTNPGLQIGTPGYMAPEQAAGRPVDHRADIYAWGLLARELLTGTRDRAKGPATGRPELPRSLAALIDACLALDPGDRPQSARMLVAALDGMPTARPASRKWRTVAAGIGAVALLAGIGWWTRRVPELPPVGSITGPMAVLPLRNETGDSALAGWGRLAGDWITQGLHESGLIPVIPWPTMVIVAGDSVSRGSDVVATIRQHTGAATIVSGAFYRTGDSLRFQASITDARSGRLLAAVPPVVVPRDSAAAAVRELRQRLMGAVAVAFDERLPAVTTLNQRPPTWEAYRLFDQGLAEYNRYRYKDAIALMNAAFARDTTFTTALIYAAMATSNSSDVAGGDSVIQRVLARRATLSAYHVALAEFIQAYLQGDRARALQHIERSIALAPGSRAAYNQAYILMQLNRPAEAEAALQTLDPDHGPMRDWPSYWSQRAYAAHLTGRYEDELRFAREQRRRFPEQRIAWVLEARALAAMGRAESLDSLFRVAETLDPDVYWSQGAMREVAAEEFAIHGSGDSTAAFTAAAAWLEQRLVDHPTERGHRSWLSQAYLGLGRYGRAEQVLVELAREEPKRLYYRGQLATLAARRGDGAGAARQLSLAANNSRGEFEVYRARIAALQGRRDEAIARLSEALSVGVYNWYWMHHEMQRDLASLASDLRYQRLVVPIASAPR